MTVLLAGMLCAAILTRAQLFKRLADCVKQTTEQNAGQKIDRQVNKTIDDAVAGKKKTGKKDSEKPQPENSNSSEQNQSQSSNPAQKAAS